MRSLLPPPREKLRPGDFKLWGCPKQHPGEVVFVGAQIDHPQPSYAEHTVYAHTGVRVFYTRLSQRRVHAVVTNAGA